MAFLQRNREIEDTSYFLNPVPYSIPPILGASDGVAADVQAQVAEQSRILENLEWAESLRNTQDYPRVAELVEQIPNSDSIDVPAHALESMGPRAVPGMILLLDDHRPLRSSSLSLRNDPGWFESKRFYAPKTVVDVLAAVLNQTTKESFGFIYNGAPEEERQQAINGWRVFLFKTLSAYPRN